MTKGQIALKLQDAYGWALHATGEMGMDPRTTKSVALKRAVSCAAQAGLKFVPGTGTITLANAHILRDEIEAFGRRNGIDAYTGQVLS